MAFVWHPLQGSALWVWDLHRGIVGIWWVIRTRVGGRTWDG